jgi:hypothetical protein
MSKIALSSNASGNATFTIASLGTNTDRTLDLPDAGGTVVLDTATQTLTNKTIQGGAITRDTSKTSTSGTFVDFTGIPSWVKRVTVLLNGVSTNGTSNLLLQVGAGSITNSGYTSAMHTVNTSNNSATTGFGLTSATVATTAYFGHITVSNFSGNIWIESHMLGAPAGNYTSSGGGTVTLAGVLDRLRVTTVNGTDAFDAGSINIMYEG